MKVEHIIQCPDAVEAQEFPSGECLGQLIVGGRCAECNEETNIGLALDKYEHSEQGPNMG